MKKIILSLSLLTVTVLFARTASATVIDILPDSTHKQGSTIYNEVTTSGTLYGRIDFAVYDTLTFPGEFAGQNFSESDIGGTGRFIYAYQIFNDYDPESELAVASFTLLNTANCPINSTGSQDDEDGGVAPSGILGKGSWAFAGGILSVGKHSYFLVFRSPNDCVPGTYAITPSSELLIPDVPEPCSLALLAVGSAIVLRKRSRRVCGT